MNRKILVVDDDQKTRALLKAYLEKNQYEVRLAHDGASFMAEFERYKDDLSLVILDVMLPDTDGFVLCAHIRKRSSIPVIMLTASADDTDKIVGLELGADDYLASPTTRANCWRASRPCIGARAWKAARLRAFIALTALAWIR